MPHKKLIVRDPIHGFIKLDTYDFVPKIISTPQFQRLRHIEQLGFSSFVYPTATHNRFSHSIGAMHVFLRMFDLVGEIDNKDLAQSLRKLGTAAILLHDIGHGPFSHASEPIFNFKHEDITIDIAYMDPISSILELEGIKTEDIRKVIKGTVPNDSALVSQLVTSQLDADRLDYLVRDAYFTGAGFGNIDLERIISMLTLCKDGELDGHVITQNKGRYSLESYVLARHLMYMGVYFHKTTIGMELLFRKIFKRILDISKEKLNLPPNLEFVRGNGKVKAEDILALNDHDIYALIAVLSKHDDEILSSLCKRVMTRDLLKAVEIPADKMTDSFDETQAKVAEIANKEKIDSDYFCHIGAKGSPRYYPYNPKGADDTKTVITNIFFTDETGQPVEISTRSLVVYALSQSQQTFRIYCPAKIEEQIRRTFLS